MDSIGSLNFKHNYEISNSNFCNLLNTGHNLLALSTNIEDQNQPIMGSIFHCKRNSALKNASNLNPEAKEFIPSPKHSTTPVNNSNCVKNMKKVSKSLDLSPKKNKPETTGINYYSSSICKFFNDKNLASNEQFSSFSVNSTVIQIGDNLEPNKSSAPICEVEKISSESGIVKQGIQIPPFCNLILKQFSFGMYEIPKTSIGKSDQVSSQCLSKDSESNIKLPVPMDIKVENSLSNNCANVVTTPSETCLDTNNLAPKKMDTSRPRIYVERNLSVENRLPVSNNDEFSVQNSIECLNVSQLNECEVNRENFSSKDKQSSIDDYVTDTDVTDNNDSDADYTDVNESDADDTDVNESDADDTIVNESEDSAITSHVKYGFDDDDNDEDDDDDDDEDYICFDYSSSNVVGDDSDDDEDYICFDHSSSNMVGDDTSCSLNTGTAEASQSLSDENDYNSELFRVDLHDKWVEDGCLQISAVGTSLPGFFNISTSNLPVVDCVSVIIFSKEEHEANKKWADEIDKNCACRTPCKVQFSPKVDSVYVEHWDRKGEWEMHARDRMRLARHIEKILTPTHREKVFNRLYATSD